jgi:hypothetical protein
MRVWSQESSGESSIFHQIVHTGGFPGGKGTLLKIVNDQGGGFCAITSATHLIGICCGHLSEQTGPSGELLPVHSVQLSGMSPGHSDATPGQMENGNPKGGGVNTALVDVIVAKKASP